MRRTIWLVLLAPFIWLVVTSSATASSQGPGPVQPPSVPKNDVTNQPYAGTVTEVTKNSITIQWTATPGEKPKRFTVSGTLAAGRTPKEPRRTPSQPRGYTVGASEMYRLTDVKVGDRVMISYAHLGDTDICDHICIQKRPGGRVPPLPEEAEELRKHKPPGEPEPDHIRYDEWMNAHWDLEDKGIPYPKKFGPMRRWPVAPMPRAVGPHISQ
jgi:hypothetical protein